MMDVSEEPRAKVSRQDTDFCLCIICQQQTNEELVKKPRAYKSVVHFISERADLGDGDYPEIKRRLNNLTDESLKSNNASWHRTCYVKTCSKEKCKRAETKFEEQVSLRANPTLKDTSQPLNPVSSTNVFTRSKSKPYNSDVCFFCDGEGKRNNPLFRIRTDKAGKNLHEAIKKSNNNELLVKLNTAIDPKDAHAIDIQYHNKCYSLHVTNVLRKQATDVPKEEKVKCEMAADIEFLSLVQEALRDDEIIPMENLHGAYENIRKANCVPKYECHRRKVKKLLQDEIEDIEFTTPRQRNMSELVSIKSARDFAISVTYETENEVNADTRTLFEASVILRKAILRAQRWTFCGSLTDITDEQLPSELYTFYRWILQGTKSNLCSESKTAVVDQKAKTLAQTTMSLHLSNYQASNKSNHARNHEMPQQLAIGVAIRQATRGKNVINLLHKFGVSVSYDRVLRLEAQIAGTVLSEMEEYNGLYIPHDIVSNKHVFFAVDNVDFAEDTVNGKNTLHGTVMTIYQRQDSHERSRHLVLDKSTQARSLKDPPEVNLLSCRMPKSPKPPSPTYPNFQLNEDNVVNDCKDDLVWLVGQSIRGPVLPVWAGYNSMLNKSIPLTTWHTPPLIPAPAHEWQTLLTVLKQARDISVRIVGSQRKTVVTLDMGLYKPAKQLQMARKDCDHLILRPGELHMVMAQLRTIGTYIDNSGLDLCWCESDLYGSATVKQILEGKHVKRGIQAHLTSLQALFKLYGDAFFQQNPDVLEECSRKAELLVTACTSDNYEDVQVAHSDFTQALNTLGISQQMETFDESHGALGKALICYMQMVLEMMMYIRAVRTGNWRLHLHATEAFIKYFFAHDKLNYARLMPLYLAEMNCLEESDPEIWEEFIQGNWVVNKNTVPFCAIGADHALEQVNRMMKVGGGIVGITQNPSALTKFFLVAPELSHIAEEARQMVGMKSAEAPKHHELRSTKVRQQEDNVTTLTETIKKCIDPFSDECDELINILTKAIMPEKIRQDIARRNEIGQEMYAAFVTDRITDNSINLWAPMKKRKLLTWSPAL